MPLDLATLVLKHASYLLWALGHMVRVMVVDSPSALGWSLDPLSGRCLASLALELLIRFLLASIQHLLVEVAECQQEMRCPRLTAGSRRTFGI